MTDATAISPPKTRQAGVPENLFLRFALLDLGHNEFQKFANKFGTLDGADDAAETWAAEVTEMRKAIGLWLALRRTRGETVEDEVATMFPEPPADMEFSGAGDFLASIFPDAPWSHETMGVFARLREMLAAHLGPKRVQVGVTMDVDNLRLAAEATPTALGGRLWMQLANAITEDWSLRACGWCRTPFRPADPRSMYCSNSCKVSASRARRKA